jgi:hypothetical protein
MTDRKTAMALIGFPLGERYPPTAIHGPVSIGSISRLLKNLKVLAGRGEFNL